MMKDKLYSIVDIETTGSSYVNDRIIEVGMIQVKNNEIVREFSSFVNPKKSIPSNITFLTGIKNEDVKCAPLFNDIASSLYESLENSIFVAHFVNFDYGFLQAEFKRCQYNFHLPRICSVMLSKRLFPQHARHNLDSIIERFGLICENRHRALDDAKVIKQFFDLLPSYVKQEQIEETFKSIQRQIKLPKHLSFKNIEEIPNTCGVYLLYGNEDIPLYIGKSKQMRNRILSHFGQSTKKTTELHIFNQVKKN